MARYRKASFDEFPFNQGSETLGAGYSSDRLAQNIRSNIQKISQNVFLLEKLVRQIGTPQDSEELRDKMYQTGNCTNQLAKDTNRDIKGFAHLLSNSNLNKHRQMKLQKENLIEEFLNVLKRFQTVQRTAAEKERASLSQALAAPAYSPLSDVQFSTQGYSQTALVMAMMNDVDLDLIRKRESVIPRLRRDITDVNESFQDIKQFKYLREQGVVLGREGYDRPAQNIRSDVLKTSPNLFRLEGLVKTTGTVQDSGELRDKVIAPGVLPEMSADDSGRNVRNLPRGDYKSMHSGSTEELPGVQKDISMPPIKDVSDQFESTGSYDAVGAIAAEITGVQPSVRSKILTAPDKMATIKEIDQEMDRVARELAELEAEESLLDKSNKLHAMKLALREKQRKVKCLRDIQLHATHTKYTNRDMKDLAHLPSTSDLNEPRKMKSRKEKLAKKFRRFFNIFKKKKRTTAEMEPANSRPFSGSDNNPLPEKQSDAQFSKQGNSQTAQVLAMENDADLRLIRQRGTAISQLEIDIMHINQMFIDLHDIIHEQGEDLDTISYS